MEKIDQKLNSKSNNRCQNLNDCVQQVKQGSYAFINVMYNVLTRLTFNLLNYSTISFTLYNKICMVLSKFGGKTLNNFPPI